MTSDAKALSGQGNSSFAVSMALLLLRLSLGATFIFHGGQKCFGWADGMGIEAFSQMLHLPILPKIVWAWMAAGSEFGCGVLILIGFLSRLASIPLIIVMLVAIATATGSGGYSLRVDMATFKLLAVGYEFNVTLIAMLAAILLAGPGLVSVDAYVFRRGLWAHGPQPLGNPQPRV